jgi:prepilin-type N-terminal cleavage/methylation domain-containing protein
MRTAVRRGLSLIEVLVVLSIMGLMYVLVAPRISAVREQSSLRAARQELSSAFAMARASALQKGKTATLTMSSISASVSVNSGLTGQPVQIYGPLMFNKELNSSLSAVNGAPMTVSFDARGLVTPMALGISRYRIATGTRADTICISPAGIILPKDCQL